MEFLPMLIPLIGVSIPLVIVAGRFVVQPIVEALTRLAATQGSRELGPLEQRLAATESRLASIERSLDRVLEEQEFQRKLLASRAGRLADTVRSEASGS